MAELEIRPVILSGGMGTRLWPVSRARHPKPFMRMSDGLSLLQKTFSRAQALPGCERVLTVTNREMYFQSRDHYAELEPTAGMDYLLEPMGRNTAPALALAALQLVDAGAESVVMVVLPADHLIPDQEAFADAVSRAAQLAAAGDLVVFGVAPDAPETGFGYVEQGEAIAGIADSYRVARFVEKPNVETAQAFLASGKFAWNSGMFCFTPTVYLQALKQHAADVYDTALACWQASDHAATPMELSADHFAALPDISVDYAVMEHADNVAAVRASFGWNDIGSWNALAGLETPDANGNQAAEQHILVNSSNTYVRDGGGRTVAAVGVDNLLVVDTPDALLIADRDQAQDVKKVVAELKKRDNTELHILHNTVHRPWGTYTVLEDAEGHKIKRIMVKQGASLSLQMHHHRSEHWIVVAGTAEVVNGDQTFLVRTNESTYIPAGTQHRLSNPGVVPLQIIEVQSGEYLGEDDIVRFEDVYGRAG